MKTVLIADDEEVVRALVAATIDGDRYTVLLAKDGEEALQMARNKMPDLLFLDIMMPKKNGYDVCHELKDDPATRHIKVVMLTALAQDADRKKALFAGADDYFTKPFSPTALLQKVGQFLDEEGEAPPLGGPDGGP